MNLNHYLQRIQYRQPVAPTLAVLRDLVFHHVTAIAFENLNPLLGQPVSLEIDDLEDKLVTHGRGGYCFEHNLLFLAVLEAIGFKATGLAARVMWMQPEDSIFPRSHMLLRVEQDGRSYIADVGFGGLTPTGVLELVADVEQPTPHETFRLTRADTDWRLQALLGDTWQSLYRFDMQHQHAPLDYEAANYYVSTHPESFFTDNLLAARPTREGRYGLRNRDFTIRGKNGEVRRRTLNSVDEIRAVLANEFQIALPESEHLTARLAQLP